MPSEDYTLELDFTPLVEGVEQIIEAFNGVMESLAAAMQPRPWAEAQDLRDLAREHDLDRVDRGPARIRRCDGALVVTWDGDELTRYSTEGV